jgi:hypothetical protein
MAKIITENFKIENTNELFRSLDTQDYFLAASRSMTKNEFQSAVGIRNTQVSKRDFLRKIIFGKKITTDNARFMFAENAWTKGTVYDQYDDSKDIETLNMIVTVRENNSGAYFVYKCLDNNNGATSEEITGTVDPENYQMAVTQDGYRWQYMFKVLPSEVVDFGVNNDLPLPVISGVINGYGDADVRRSTEESISNIIIENTTSSQFNQYLFGEANSVNDTSDVIVIDGDSTSTGAFRNIVVTASTKSGRALYSSRDAYKNMYIRNSENGKLYDVVSSTSNPATNQITLRLKTSDIFTEQQVCQLLIKVNVSTSSLNGVRAKAYLILDPFGTAKDVGFETRGTEYKIATAEVVCPPLLKTSASVINNPTVLRAIVSPTGGHGSDPISEMAMSKLSMTSTIIGGSGNVPDVGEYSTIGLLKNPTFSDDSGNSLELTDFDNRTVLTISGTGHIDASLDVTVESTGQVIHKGLVGGGLVNQYVEQYIKTISIQEISEGVSYTIVSKGTDLGLMKQNDFTAIGAVGDDIGVGDIFTATNVASVNSEKNALVSFVVDRVDTTNANYDYSLDIVRAKIHDITEDTDTRLHLVDYEGDFQHKFQRGIVYIKETPTASVSINNKIVSGIEYGEYDTYSGDLLHFIDFSPITRDPAKNENIKFTFDF